MEKKYPLFNNNHIKSIIYDFDGTLVDTMGGFGEIASLLINKYYGIPIDKAKKKYFITSGIPFFQQLEKIFPNNDMNSMVAEEYEEKKLDGFFSTHLPQKTINFLFHLKNKYTDLKLVVSSNNFQNLVENFITKNNIHIFDLILGYKENFSKGKDHFNYVKKYFGFRNTELLFIGDSLLDAKRAIDNKIQFIAYSGTFNYEYWKKKFPDIKVISKIEEIDNFFGDNNCKQLY